MSTANTTSPTELSTADTPSPTTYFCYTVILFNIFLNLLLQCVRFVENNSKIP